MTPSAVEKLIKYIDLEASRGYDNRAVMGGLERAAETWQEEASAGGIAGETVAEVAAALGTYPALAPEARRDTLQALRARLLEVEAGEPLGGGIESESEPVASSDDGLADSDELDAGADEDREVPQRSVAGAAPRERSAPPVGPPPGMDA
ncbi:MAG: ATP-dependent DNA helicase RecG, partial [Anaerolineales bacterium]|nr:ATP-dependent DNA helicase RecG [Anaerolineales bacterium]